MTRALNIKPVINLVEGQLKLMTAARSFQGGLRRTMESVERLAPLEYLAVAHTRRQEMAEQVADWLAERLGFPREHIWVCEAGPVLACHAGPGVVGVLAVSAR
jgi:fatty acid kinase fatty acid binding subunit